MVKQSRKQRKSARWKLTNAVKAGHDPDVPLERMVDKVEVTYVSEIPYSLNFDSGYGVNLPHSVSKKLGALPSAYFGNTRSSAGKSLTAIVCLAGFVGLGYLQYTKSIRRAECLRILAREEEYNHTSPESKKNLEKPIVPDYCKKENLPLWRL
jgi:hypothetical protein